MMKAFSLSAMLLAMTTCCCYIAQGYAEEIHTVSSSVIGVTDKDSWTGVTLPSLATAIDQGRRRTKSTKSAKGGSGSNNAAKQESSSDPSSSKTKAPGDLDVTDKPIKVSATGLTMTLGGVDPLDSEARAVWEEVTRDFIGADIMRVSTELEQLEVSVSLDSQNPPYNGDKRVLSKSGVRGTHPPRELADGVREMIVQITFDVGIELESEVQNHNANRYVAHAFNSDAREIAYMRMLLATGNPAFANIGSVDVDAKLVSTGSSAKAKEIGAIVGFAVMGLLCVLTICYIMYGTRSGEDIVDDDEDEEKDISSDKPSKTETDSVSSDEDVPNEKSTYKLPTVMSPDEASLVSCYYDGNISVAWSMDTDIPATPRVNNSKGNLLGALSRESSEGSLYNEDDDESEMVGPRQQVPAVKSLRPTKSSHVVTPSPPEEGKLYEV